MASIFGQEFAEQAFDMLAAILDQSQECVLLIDRDDRLAYINAAGRGHLGLSPNDSLFYDEWLAYWPKDSQSGIRKAVAGARAGQADRFEGLCSHDPDPSRWCELEITPVHDRSGTLSHVLVIARDVTETVTLRQDEQRRREDAEREAVLSDGVAREMRHRFKNQLAVIASLLRLSARGAATTADLTARFEQRLGALSRAQDFLSVHRGEQMTAADAIEQIVRASGAGERVEMGSLPNTLLSDDAVQSLALILGELQTNALKHGALASPGGRITLSATEEDGRVGVRWIEECEAAVTPPEQQGGGLKLLDRMGSLPGAKAAVDWRPNGVAVDFYVRRVPPTG